MKVKNTIIPSCIFILTVIAIYLPAISALIHLKQFMKNCYAHQFSSVRDGKRLFISISSGICGEKISKMLDANYLIREADENEKDSIVSFVNEHYIPDTIIMNGYLKKNKDRVTPKDREEIFEIMQKNVYRSTCLVAINRKDKKIVGTVILLPVASADLNKVQKSKESETLSLLQEFDRQLLVILKKVQLFEKYSERKNMVNMRYLSTHKDHRCKGIAKALVGESIGLAKKYGFDLIYSFYTQPGSKKSAEAAGFKKVADYDLYDARDASGASIVADLGSNNVTSVMALAIDY